MAQACVAASYLSLDDIDTAERTAAEIMKDCADIGCEFTLCALYALEFASVCKLKRDKGQEGLELARACRQYFTKLVGEDNYETYSAQLAEASARILLGDGEEAENILTSVVDKSSRLLGPESKVTMYAIQLLGAAQLQRHNFDQGEATLLKSLDIFATIHPEVAHCSESYKLLMIYYDAAEMKEKAEELKRRFDPEHASVEEPKEGSAQTGEVS
jgi:tetratricopeptide (TPR) repeat protein